MNIENKTRSVFNVCKFLLSNIGRWISDYEIEEITKKYFEEIINELVAHKVVINTKDGTLFERENIDAMKLYLRMYDINI